ncbi:TRAP transporter small permease [Chloroflexota bacterium]
MLSVSAEVATRQIVGRSFSWVIEVNEYGLLYVTFLVATWVLRREGHVGMDLVLNKLKPRTQAKVNINTSVVGAIICLVLAWYSAQSVLDNFRLDTFIDSPLEPPKYAVLAIIPFGTFLLFIQFLRRTYGYFGSLRAS